MPGPAPNPDARRRNDRNAWRILPASCTRPAPKSPIPGRPAAKLWAHLWSLPQAELWHEQNAVLVVARYARMTLSLDAAYDVAGEGSPVDVSKIAAELRQIEDRLLISPSTLIRARCVIAEPEIAGAADKSAEVVTVDFARRHRKAS